MRLVARNINYRYSERSPVILDDFSLIVEPGSYWCLAGPNGSGKSTFLRLACGLVPLTHFSGSLLLDERELARWTRLELARKIAFVPGALKTQYPVIVEEFVLQGRFARSSFWTRPSKTDHAIAEASLERVGIIRLAGKLITEISAGESQLALIARAITQQPEVLVLDEATANLDLAFQSKIFALLKELNQAGMTILIVSHDLNLAAEFCPNVIWLKRGRVVAQGEMAQTLTTSLMQELYGAEALLEVGKNPLSSRPKVFWRPL